jgi:lipopolysaccharide heptosyltransferase II
LSYPQNILIYSLVNIGDVLLTTSATALIRKAYPQAHITAMVRKESAPILQNHPLIDDVLIYTYQSKKISFADQLTFVKEIRRRKFDLCFAFDGKSRSALLTWLAGIPVRVGADRVFDDRFAWSSKIFSHTIHIEHDLLNTHQALTYQAIVRGYTRQTEIERPVLGKITAEQQSKAQSLLDSLPKKKYAIALCVKGTFPLKDWPQEYFARLVEKLNEHYDANFYIIGAPGDKAYADSVIQLSASPIRNFCGQTTLMELAALFAKSDLFITVDTGALHIAATTAVPIVAMYGCSSPKRWSPLTEKATIYFLDKPCCPCRIHPEECPGKECLTEISVDQVFEGACRWLDQNVSS